MTQTIKSSQQDNPTVNEPTREQNDPQAHESATPLEFEFVSQSTFYGKDLPGGQGAGGKRRVE